MARNQTERVVKEVELTNLTVQDILGWKLKNSSVIIVGKRDEKEQQITSIESWNQEYTDLCGGEDTTDVLYSFLSIYALGVWVYNKDLEIFQCDENRIKVRTKKDGKYNQYLYSKKFLLSLQKKPIAGIQVKELNEFLQNFIKVFFSVGNLIPMWPGGNTLKGNQNNGFMDIPELYFTKYEAWYKFLAQHENAYLQEMTRYMKENKENLGSLKSFLGMFHSIEDYKNYVEHIIEIIINREKAIKNGGLNI